MTIDWPAFLAVLGAALAGSLAAVALFSVGVRLLATPIPESTGDIDLADADDDDGEDDPTTPPRTRPTAATVGAVAAFALAALVALGGVVLIVR